MFGEWIQNIVVFLILMTLIRQIIPEEKYHKYVGLALGLIMILILIMPAAKILGMEETVYQNFIQEQIEMYAADASVSGKMFASEQKYNESYRQILAREIESYFKESSMIVRYCEIDMNENMESEHYGEIYEIRLGILPTDQEIGDKKQESSICVGPIHIGDHLSKNEKKVYIPDEKMKEWKQDLSLQFGIEKEQLKLEIVS